LEDALPIKLAKVQINGRFQVRVSQILKSKGDMVFTVSPNETVAAASALLHARRVGAMVVMELQDQVAGILSERDVVRAVAEGGAEALAKPVRDFMTADVVFADLSESVDALMLRMTDRRFRHMPVCQDGRLVGIVSIGDLVKSKIAETVAEAQHLKDYIAAG
jgi:CBS domain-containing protein